MKNDYLLSITENNLKRGAPARFSLKALKLISLTTISCSFTACRLGIAGPLHLDGPSPKTDLAVRKVHYEPWMKQAEDLINTKILAALKRSSYFETVNQNDRVLNNESIQILKTTLREAESKRNNEVYINNINALANFYIKQGMYREAEESEKLAIEAEQKSEKVNKFKLLESLEKLAEMKLTLQKYDDLPAIYKRTIAIAADPDGRYSGNLAKAFLNYAAYHQFRGDYRSDFPLFKRSLDIWKSKLKKNPTDVDALLGCAEVYEWTNNRAKYNQFLERALRVVKGKQKVDYLLQAQILGKLSIAAFTIEQTEQYAKARIKLLEDSVGSNNPLVAIAKYDLGSIYKSQANYVKAKELFESAYSIQKTKLPLNHPDTANTLYQIAGCCLQLKDYSNAEQYYWISILKMRNSYGIDSPIVASYLQEGPLFLYEITKQNDSIEILTKYCNAFKIHYVARPRIPKYNL